MTPNEAWAVLADYIEGQDDLSDEQCTAVETLNDHFRGRDFAAVQEETDGDQG